MNGSFLFSSLSSELSRDIFLRFSLKRYQLATSRREVVGKVRMDSKWRTERVIRRALLLMIKRITI